MLYEQVKALESRHHDAMTLLGSIVTTLTLPRNVAVLEKEEGGRKVVEMANDWLIGFRRLEKQEP